MTIFLLLIWALRVKKFFIFFLASFNTFFDDFKTTVEIEKLIKNIQLTSAGIVLDEEFVECNPTAANANHHCASENTNQAELLTVPKLEKSSVEQSKLINR